MSESPRLCVVVPVYNHALTVRQVVRGARQVLPVIVVNDGSTDATAESLAEEVDLEVLTLPRNQGKGAALVAGFRRALELGYTHAITLDADGQHPVEALPALAAACRDQPQALIVGVRDLKAAGAPRGRRVTNAFSNFWFRVETGVALHDTQSGLRCYPLETIANLRVRASRYAWELEILVRAAWSGVQLLPLRVGVDYQAPTSRLSHFHPVRDLLQVSRLHSSLAMQAFCLPAPLRRLAAQGSWDGHSRRHRLRTALRHLLEEHTQTPGRIASAVGLGLFCGVAPIWGYQMALAALLAHALRLNKSIALCASNISFPLASPFILAAGLVLGHWLRTGAWLDLQLEGLIQRLPLFLWDWVIGSLVLAAGVGLTGLAVTYLIARAWPRTARP